MSANVSATASGSTQRPTPRMPGVSISTPPVGSTCMSRDVVVCRPFESPGPHVTNGRDVLTEQRVDEARLPGAGLTEHRHRLVARALAQPVETDALARRGDDHLDPGARRGDLLGHGVRRPERARPW